MRLMSDRRDADTATLVPRSDELCHAHFLAIPQLAACAELFQRQMIEARRHGLLRVD